MAKLKCSKCAQEKNCTPDRYEALVKKYKSTEAVAAAYECRSCRPKKSKRKAVKADPDAEISLD